jgi:hypothetical protein
VTFKDKVNGDKTIRSEDYDIIFILKNAFEIHRNRDVGRSAADRVRLSYLHFNGST